MDNPSISLPGQANRQASRYMLSAEIDFAMQERTMLRQPEEIIAFWLQAGAKKWFAKDAAFDQEIHARGAALHARAAAGELLHWEASESGTLALILLLDQFSRNLHRNTPQAFAQDALALALARRAIFRGIDRQLPAEKRWWLYMPFMHSEDVLAQRCGLGYFRALGNAEALEAALEHVDIIERFGRFPHRNPVLGRKSTAAELAYLAGGGFSG